MSIVGILTIVMMLLHVSNMVNGVLRKDQYWKKLSWCEILLPVVGCLSTIPLLLSLLLVVSSKAFVALMLPGFIISFLAFGGMAGLAGFRHGNRITNICKLTDKQYNITTGIILGVSIIGILLSIVMGQFI